jgi:site-specific recombinase XerD
MKCRSLDRFAHIDYMSEKAVQAILQCPNPRTKLGLRDQFAMILLYDTGARIQELLDIRLCDLKLGSTPEATLHGKGNKTRRVPLMANTVQHLKNYMQVYHKGEHWESEQLLFYTEHKGERTPVCADTMRKRIQKYAGAARQMCTEVPERVNPHLWRHSRAMHLYQHGMDLSLVSQWLGHSNIETTRIYAYADTETTREAIVRAMQGSPESSGTAEKYTVTDESLLRLLYGL